MKQRKPTVARTGEAGPRANAPRNADPHGAGPQIVDPGWLLRAGAIVLLFALLCGYGTFCLLFYQGQWQLMLRPVRTAARPATIGGEAVQLLRFGTDASGVPQRTAWWLPGRQDGSSQQDGNYGGLVLMFLPSGQGSLVDAVPTLTALEQLGLSIFAMDYRGYGESAEGHPSEQRMRADADAAWTYLVSERGFRENRVLPYGVGVGASLAMGLAERHPAAPAVVLDAPRFDVPGQVKADPRAHLLPVSLLLHDRFALEPELAAFTRPKLILTRDAAENRKALRAGDPKMTVLLPKEDDAAFVATLRRFLDLYASPTRTPQLLPANPSAHDEGVRKDNDNGVRK